MSYRPQDKTIFNVLNYLESIGLQVTGGAIDLETGMIEGCHMNFIPQDVLRYRYLHEKGRIHNPPPLPAEQDPFIRD